MPDERDLHSEAREGGGVVRTHILLQKGGLRHPTRLLTDENGNKYSSPTAAEKGSANHAREKRVERDNK